MHVCVFFLFPLRRAIYVRPILCQNAPTMCTNTDHSPQEQALKNTGLPRLTDNWVIGCAGGDTRLCKAKSRPSPHELPRLRNVSERKLTVRSILFSLVLTQAGKEQFNFTAFALTWLHFTFHVTLSISRGQISYSLLTEICSLCHKRSTSQLSYKM